MHSKLRIAQVAPLSESVPPKLYGGTERIVATLTDELVRQGHAVTLFASGDSETRARLVAPCPQALRLSEHDRPSVYAPALGGMVAQQADEFDVIHFHIAPLHFSLARRLACPHLTTLHGRLDLPHIAPLFADFPTCLLSRSPMRNADHCRRRTGSRPSTTGSGRRAAVPRGSELIPRFPGKNFSREACRSRDCDCQGVRHAAQDRGESGSDR